MAEHRKLDVCLGIEGSDEDGWHVVAEGLPDGPVRTPYKLATRAEAEAETHAIARDVADDLRDRGIGCEVRVRPLPEAN